MVGRRGESWSGNVLAHAQAARVHHCCGLYSLGLCAVHHDFDGEQNTPSSCSGFGLTWEPAAWGSGISILHASAAICRALRHLVGGRCPVSDALPKSFPLQPCETPSATNRQHDVPKEFDMVVACSTSCYVHGIAAVGRVGLYLDIQGPTNASGCSLCLCRDGRISLKPCHS